MSRRISVLAIAVAVGLIGFGNGGDASGGRVVAGDHFHFHGFHGRSVHYVQPVVHHTQVVYAAPVGYAVPAVVYQPAYVVPTTYAVTTVPVTYHTQVYAPLVPVVPQYSTVGYYYPPRPSAYLAPVSLHHHSYHGHGFRGYRPRDVEIEIDYRRDGGYRYEVDFD